MTKKVVIKNDYLFLPVKSGAALQLVKCSVNGRSVREFEIELAQGEPDFWVFIDVKEFMGENLEITINDGCNKNSLDVVQQGNDIKTMDNLYQEKYRPQFHYSARRGWINDPNGLVYYKGEYHMFYQHNPYGCKWGNMHWGHAVSSDLVHWNELGEVLYPDEEGTMFSGSGVIDTRNTSGLKLDKEDPIILLYTSAGGTSVQSKGKQFTQCIAYSNDAGQTWTKYHGNPIIGKMSNGNRDPKVIWHEYSKQWIMVLYIEKEDYAILTSLDLKNWSVIDYYKIEGTGECPDIFELPVDGNQENKRCILWSANGSYLVGNFDGCNFIEENRVITGNSIQTGFSYAAQTWSNIPKDDRRTIQIAWATIDIPNMPFNGLMTFPCELNLRTTDEGIRVYTYPVSEIEKLYGDKYSWQYQILKENIILSIDLNDELYDVSCEFDLGSSSRVIVDICGVQLTYDKEAQQLSCLNKSAFLRAEQGKVRLRILIDRVIIEVFGNGGIVYMPVGVINQGKRKILKFSTEGGEATLLYLNAIAINSIWT